MKHSLYDFGLKMPNFVHAVSLFPKKHNFFFFFFFFFTGEKKKMHMHTFMKNQEYLVIMFKQ